jgi:hypothetical protein
MRISKLWQEKLKDKPYDFEYTGNITLKVDGFEIAKDWLSPELLLELEQLIEDALKDALLSNRTPYFTFKENLSLAEIRIRGIVNQQILLNLSTEKLIERCVRRTKLPQEEVILLLSKNHPEVFQTPPHGAL